MKADKSSTHMSVFQPLPSPIILLNFEFKDDQNPSCSSSSVPFILSLQMFLALLMKGLHKVLVCKHIEP